MLSMLSRGVLVALALGCVSASTSAQVQVKGPVSFLVKKQFGRPDLVAMVRVDRSKYPRPVIAIKESALTPDLLVAATDALERATEQFAARRRPFNIEFTTKSRIVDARPESASWARDIISQLSSQQELIIAFTGRARELITTLPAKR